ncbi:MAG: Gfo/Idh/MocA family oxidoreductase, partial [Chloroflexota bacterium]
MSKTVPALPKSSPRIAVIGCGAITEWFYLPALARHPSVLQKLILVDRDEARAQKLARQFNVQRCLADYHEVLDEVDGAIIAVPTHFHYPIAMEFLVRGIPILCEKPLAETAVKAREMVAQAQKSGVALATNYTRRLYASY